jgi:EVE domain-containing protein
MKATRLSPTGEQSMKSKGQTGRGWLGVVSRAHVQRGVAGSFAQLCHGRADPLGRMSPGDWLVYYSPTTEYGGGVACRAFTAIGQVTEAAPYRFDMGDGFVPARREVVYLTAREVPIVSLSGRLLLTARPSWGMMLRRGHLPLEPADLAVIAEAMGVDLAAGARVSGRAAGAR